MSDNKKKKAIQRPNRTILSRTLFLLALCGIVAFAVLAVKLYDVQIRQHEYYEAKALAQQVRPTTITASRGTIYDVNGKILAQSASVENVFISPVEMIANDESPELIAEGLSAILGVDKESILEKAGDSTKWYKTIKQKIEEEEAAKVREFIKEHELLSVHLEAASKRYYPYSSLACQLIGFVGDENTGIEGLELRYDKQLTGVDGRVVRLKTEKGTDLLFTDYEDYYDAQNGNDMTLTIDATIQYYIEKHLAQAIADYDVQKGGAAIAMNPKTGAILGMASFNNYDLNNYLEISDEEKERLNLITDEEERKKEFSNALYRQWRNKCLADTYEPGSVFKIITLAMGLEEGVISEKDQFTCTGSITFPGRDESNPLHCWKRSGHGTQTLNKAIQNSCNVALFNIGMQVGAERFYDYAEAFGLFSKTGFDLDEAGSLWWPKNDFLYWANVDNNYSSLAVASFGQTFNITPIQLITAVSAAINGGNLMQPYVVKQIVGGNGETLELREPTVVRQAISSKTSDLVRTILESVVKEGTGKNAQVRGYRVGGKTGTSEKVADDAARSEGEKEYIVSFCGFAPADDPAVILLLLLDTPANDTGVYVSGGAMAAPVVGNMLADILPYLGIAPHYSEQELAELDVAVPRLTSLSPADAEQALKKLGFDCKIIGEGDAVTGQLPAANAVVAPGTKILVYAGEEAPGDMVTVPDLGGMTYSKAKQNLESIGLFIKTTGALKSDSKAAVSIQSIPEGTETALGTVVGVTLIDGDAVELRSTG